MKRSFIVTIEVPDEGKDPEGFIIMTTPTDMRDYVRDAVEIWGGQYHYRHPFFSPKVKVRPVKNPS